MSLILFVSCLFALLFCLLYTIFLFFFFFQAEDGIRDLTVTGVQTCALPICSRSWSEAVLHDAMIYRSKCKPGDLLQHQWIIPKHQHGGYIYLLQRQSEP